MTIDRVAAERVHERFGFAAGFVPPQGWRNRPLDQWGSEGDDAVLRYLYRSLRPRRHLEFGTWQGEGTLRCLQECDATVWTLNLREGETHGDNLWRYYTDQPNDKPAAASAVSSVDNSTPHDAATRITRTGKTIYQTDSHGFIGRHIHAAGLGHRVCQIYCDSTQWDITNYPAGFFDTALIDGGHTPPVVVSDTRKALALVRPGGVVMWHDYCPLPEVIAKCESVRGVVEAIDGMRTWLAPQLTQLFWVEPSWLLVGVRR